MANTAGNWRALQVISDHNGGLAGTAGAVRELPIRRGLQGPTVTLLEGSISQSAGAPSLQLETHARELSPVSAYRAARAFRITDCRNGGRHGGMYGSARNNSERLRHEGWCGTG